MAKIKVGIEYKNEFMSICELYRKGFLSDGAHVKRADGEHIETALHTFVYCEDEHGIGGAQDGEESALGFAADGAKWFAGVRGGAVESGSSDFKQLIMDVAEDYHKHYSLIEFRQTIEERLQKERASLQKICRRFESGLLHRLYGDTMILGDTCSAEPENYYAVSLRVEINGGAESAPLLGKLYFREDSRGDFLPLTTTEAGKIDEYIRAAVPQEEQGESRDLDSADGRVIDNVLSVMEKVFDSGDFAEYMTFLPDYRVKIGQMLDQLATNEEKELECTYVKVLGISHVQWQNVAYPVWFGAKQAMRFVIGLNNRISLYCTSCSGAGVPLIENNAVRFPEDEPDTQYCYLNFGAENLGLTDIDIAYIKEKSVFARHLLTVSCPENPRNGDCSRVVCASQALTVTTENGKTAYKCKNCPYPEIVYRDIFADTPGEGMYTPAQHIDSRKCAFTQAKTATCACCGREFRESDLGRGKLCAFCGSVAHTNEGKALYKKYGKMLPAHVRLTHWGRAKDCREDGDILLFVLGKDRYVFNKLSLRESGYVPSPKKFKQKGGAR